MTSVSAGYIILTPIQPVGSGRPQQESNPGPPHQELRALPTELPPPPPPPEERETESQRERERERERETGEKIAGVTNRQYEKKRETGKDSKRLLVRKRGRSE